MTRIVKVFLSSPSDVIAEQESVRALADEINDVIAFLAPDLDVRLTVLRYQDDVYPDMDKPQDIVDRRIPQDFDIYLGIMWMRYGTPTRNELSGTVHEFRKAMVRRKATGRPIIMFYFSDEAPPVMPSAQDLIHLGKVLEFRDELQQIGLTMAYPNRASFRQRVRGGLLRAIADVLNGTPAECLEQPDRDEAMFVVPAKMTELAKAYDDVRIEMPSGVERTRKKANLFGKMAAEAPGALKSLKVLKASPSAGMRLAAIAVLRAFPQADQLDWLAERLNPKTDTPFVGYQAAASIAQAVQSLPPEANATLERTIDNALRLAKLIPDDAPRIQLLEQAQQELRIKQKQSGG